MSTVLYLRVFLGRRRSETSNQTGFPFLNGANKVATMSGRSSINLGESLRPSEPTVKSTEDARRLASFLPAFRLAPLGLSGRENRPRLSLQ